MLEQVIRDDVAFLKCALIRKQAGQKDEILMEQGSAFERGI